MIKMSWRKCLWLCALIVGAFGIQAAAYTADELMGDYAFLLSLVLIVVAAAVVGSIFARRFVLLAAIAGGIIGLTYWVVDWQFIRVLRVYVLHQFTENNISWIAGLYALLMWPIVIACAVAAAIFSWRQRGAITPQ